MRTYTTVMTVLTVAVIALAATGMAVSYLHDSTIDGDLTVKDMRGREVSVPSDVTKVACAGSGSLRIVSYFGTDKIIGIDSRDFTVTGPITDYNMAAYRVAYDIRDWVGSGNIADTGRDLANAEALMASGAQVIFTTSENVDLINDIQTKTGIPVIGLRAEVDFDLDDMTVFNEQLRLIGKVLNKSARAESLISGIQNLMTQLDLYRAAVGERNYKSAYAAGVMIPYQDANLYSTSGKYIPFSWSCADNIMPDQNNGKPYRTTPEAIITGAPEYIFVDTCYYAACLSGIGNDYSLLDEVPAIENGKVYRLLPYKSFNTNYECELINCFVVGNAIAPSVYDYDPEQKATEIFELFFPGAGMTYQKYADATGIGIGHVDPKEYTPK